MLGATECTRSSSNSERRRLCVTATYGLLRQAGPSESSETGGAIRVDLTSWRAETGAPESRSLRHRAATARRMSRATVRRPRPRVARGSPEGRRAARLRGGTPRSFGAKPCVAAHSVSRPCRRVSRAATLHSFRPAAAPRPACDRRPASLDRRACRGSIGDTPATVDRRAGRCGCLRHAPRLTPTDTRRAPRASQWPETARSCQLSDRVLTAYRASICLV